MAGEEQKKKKRKGAEEMDVSNLTHQFFFHEKEENFDQIFA